MRLFDEIHGISLFCCKYAHRSGLWGANEQDDGYDLKVIVNVGQIS
jgi:hypothetical protein